MDMEAGQVYSSITLQTSVCYQTYSLALHLNLVQDKQRTHLKCLFTLSLYLFRSIFFI